jgi:3-hydroxyisobutyrate dehydrogenase-like beta-hydroxyacid dehydrogenase
MGSGMAMRILDAGLPLEVYNRDLSKAAPFRERGIRVHETVRDALDGADAAFTMLSDDHALRSVINRETLRIMAPGSVHVSMSTVGAACSVETAFLAEGHGVRHLSAPVFGRPEAAASGKLRLCVSGDQPARLALAPHLSSMGEIWDFGKDPGAAPAVKIAGNFMIASLIETLSEAFSLVGNHGVEPEAFFRMMSGTLFDAPAVRTYGELILAGSFEEPGFPLSLGFKDAGLAKEAARRTRTPMALASLLEDRFLRAMARGWDRKDWCVISDLQKEDARS